MPTRTCLVESPVYSEVHRRSDPLCPSRALLSGSVGFVGPVAVKISVYDKAGSGFEIGRDIFAGIRSSTIVMALRSAAEGGEGSTVHLDPDLGRSQFSSFPFRG